MLGVGTANENQTVTQDATASIQERGSCLTKTAGTLKFLENVKPFLELHGINFTTPRMILVLGIFILLLGLGFVATVN